MTAGFYAGSRESVGSNGDGVLRQREEENWIDDFRLLIFYFLFLIWEKGKLPASKKSKISN